MTFDFTLLELAQEIQTLLHDESHQVLAELAGDLAAFATARFDRKQGQRVHVHSLAGLLHTDFQTPSIGYGEFLRATRTLTRDVREVKKALRYCVFNLLMNNRDDHAKNLAFLLDQTHGWQLAPQFDLTYCPGYRGEHFMDVAGEGKQPARSHVLKVAQDAGLSGKEAVQIIDQLLDQVSAAEIKSMASALPIRKATMLEVNRAIAANRMRLVGDKKVGQ